MFFRDCFDRTELCFIEFEYDAFDEFEWVQFDRTELNGIFNIALVELVSNSNSVS